LDQLLAVRDLAKSFGGVTALNGARACGVPTTAPARSAARPCDFANVRPTMTLGHESRSGKAVSPQKSW